MDPFRGAFSSGAGTLGTLEVCTPAAYVSTGDNGIVSLVTPAVSGPDGIRFEYLAMSLDHDEPALMRHDAQAYLEHSGGVIQAGWGLSGSMRHSAIQFHFRKPKGVVPASYAFTLKVIDSSFNSGWSSEFSLAVT
ncbi:hypothetical protein FFI94_014340 [Rhodococcus sp. KBS0724]|uniref:hypothetical protein n=1 Tax=Rhodococcus sp. KBS0724 TaxID=1179674 RepID=UPI00110E5BFE|nr:hypothetical protein [Rhodococcus sp. KBS0724]TSD47218.1 hypothetical protein FFI94_014340 [Rhodococcus sp. KBS0724]